jgi:cysteine-rich repeat protein
MRLLALALLALVAVHANPTVACNGDCDGNGTVRIEELILAVQITLDGSGVDRCPAADLDANGAITVSEIVAAVDVALSGCAPEPTPTATATPDPGLLDCGDGTLNGSEECDDGNTAGGDGCSATCQLEPGGNPCAGVPASAGVAAASVLVTDAVKNPVHVTAPRLDPRRLFIVEQEGRIRIVKDGTLLDDPFLAIEGRIRDGGEQGLLGLAFHPDFETNGRFFVDYTDNNGDTVIARYQVSADPERADPDSEKILLIIDQPYSNHNGGQVAFGPDGYLYIGMGDGGSAGDPQENAQDDGTLLGKLLRADVDVDDAPYYRVPADNPHAERGDRLGLIWAKGLRNPWRFSFDRATGDLYIADVGQGDIEEIDFQPADSRGNENYGWDIFEGSECFEPDPLPTCPDPPDGLVFPVLQYPHTGGRCSVTGGYVYQGCALPDLRGEYFFADYCTPFLQSFRLVNEAVTGLQDRTAALAPGGGRQIDNVSSFGEDARGEIYIADYDGEVYKIVPPP